MFDHARDLPDDLAQLKTLRIWHAMWLDRIDRKAAYLRQRQAEEGRRQRTRPPAPDWILELSRANGMPQAVHVGDCGMSGRQPRPVGQDEARRLLTVDGVSACQICRPDSALGIVDLADPPHGHARRRGSNTRARRQATVPSGQLAPFALNRIFDEHPSTASRLGLGSVCTGLPRRQSRLMRRLRTQDTPIRLRRGPPVSVVCGPRPGAVWATDTVASRQVV